MKYWILESQLIIADGNNKHQIASTDYRYGLVKEILLSGQHSELHDLLAPKLPENFSISNGLIYYKTLLLPEVFYDLIFIERIPGPYLTALANYWWNRKSTSKESLDTFSRIVRAARPITKCGFHFIASQELTTEVYHHHSIGNWPLNAPFMPTTFIDEYLVYLHKQKALGGNAPSTVLKYVLQPELNYNPLIYIQIRERLPELPRLGTFINKGRGHSRVDEYLGILKKFPISWVKKLLLDCGFEGLDQLVGNQRLSYLQTIGVRPSSWLNAVDLLRSFRETCFFPEYPTYETEEFCLRTPRLNHELIAWSKQLKNCAHGENYERLMISAESAIYGYFSKEADHEEPILRGMIEIHLADKRINQFTILQNAAQTQAPSDLRAKMEAFLLEKGAIKKPNA